MIRVIFEQIPENGLDIQGNFASELLEIECDSRLLSIDPVQYDLHISRVGHQLLAEGESSVSIKCICDRCLENTTISVTDKKICHHIEEPSDTVDLTEYIREDIVLAFPSVYACQGGCDVPQTDDEEIDFYQEDLQDDEEESSPWDILDGLK